MDADIFFYLTAYDARNEASTAFKLAHNALWFQDSEDWPTIGSREPTPAADIEPTGRDTVAKLVIRFTHLFERLDAYDLPPTEGGIQFGTDPAFCQILLGRRGRPGISGKHFIISIDDHLRIFLDDNPSTHGTAVGGDGQNEDDFRVAGQWMLLDAPGSRDLHSRLTLHAGRLGVRIHFPNHEEPSERYMQALRRLSQECKPEREQGQRLRLKHFALCSPLQTATPSGAVTPRANRPIYYRKELLGQGAFSEVYRLVHGRTGKSFAAKILKMPEGKRKRDQEKMDLIRAIQREFTMIEKQQHPHIAQVFELRTYPMPTIVMAFYADGNIANVGPALDTAGHMTVFAQLLDGLQYLHQKGVVHRDVKPANVLVANRCLLQVVLSDFGFAKQTLDGNLLKTTCGTPKYVAPEVILDGSRGYGTWVDMWSLGVMVLEGIHGLPKFASQSKKWKSRLLSTVQQLKDSHLEDLLKGMLANEHQRWTAETCLRYGFEHELFRIREVDGLVASIYDPTNMIEALEAVLNP